jgi:RNase P subunit RPR2
VPVIFLQNRESSSKIRKLARNCKRVGEKQMKADFDTGWRELSEGVLSAMREWRFGHPRATFSEIETALDEQLDRQRAQMLEDLALASELADLSLLLPEKRPLCPDCGRPLGPRGKQDRHLQTEGDQQITLTRSYGVCPTCKVGFFPPG